jgi:nucleotide-binding universal stress UspA family protein
MSYRHLLVAVDDPEHAKPVIEHAIELARFHGAAVTLLHVVQVPSMTLPEGVIIPQPERLSRLFERANEDLSRLAAQLEHAGVARVSVRTEEGAAGREILGAAASGEYDLLLMGTHGRRGMSHLFLGSVAEHVVRGASIPVLTIGDPTTASAAHP